MVAGITKQENATADYIKEVDAALVDAIEESFANPQNAQQAVRSFSERVWTPVGEVVDQATANVRRNVVESITTKIRAEDMAMAIIRAVHTAEQTSRVI